ncbi:MAG: RidA family protein [Xenococcus sp. (in: cyanobacteria)]
MKKYYLTPATLPDWSTYFSQVAVVEKNGIKMIYLAGQVGVDNQKNLVGSGKLRDQVEQTFRNLQTALESVEATIADIIKMNIYMVNYQPEDAEIIGEVLHQYFSVGQLPAMSLIGVQALAEERFLVEVDAEAVVDTLVSSRP